MDLLRDSLFGHIVRFTFRSRCFFCYPEERPGCEYQKYLRPIATVVNEEETADNASPRSELTGEAGDEIGSRNPVLTTAAGPTPEDVFLVQWYGAGE
jgi:hypothetical protein